jgi:hypothetical protein
MVDRHPVSGYGQDKDAEKNGSLHNGPVLRDGEPNVITCEVRGNRISVDCNGTRVIDWTGDFARLSLDALWRVPHPKHLFIGSWDTHFEISKLELSALDDKAASVPKNDATRGEAPP